MASSSEAGVGGGVLPGAQDAPVDPGHWRFDFGAPRDPNQGGWTLPETAPHADSDRDLCKVPAAPGAPARRSGGSLGAVPTQPALRALRVAAFLLDEHARVVEHNVLAGELLESLPPSCFRFGVLRRIATRCTPTIPEAIRLCRANHHVQLVAVLEGAHPRIVQGTLTEVPSVLAADKRCYMLLLELPRGDGLQAAQSVAPLFGLTPAEVRVLAGLLDGVSPAAIAEAGGTSLPTVRTQISNILAKTGTAGQSELLVLLSGLR